MLPSGEIATAVTSSLWCSSVLKHSLQHIIIKMQQLMTLRIRTQDMRFAQKQQLASCTYVVLIRQILTILSSPPDMMQSPSGLTHRQLT